MSSITPGGTDPEMADRLERHEELGNAENARLIGGRVEVRPDGVLIYSTPAFGTGLNFACRIRSDEANSERLIEEIVRWYVQRHVKPHIRVSPLTRPTNLAEKLAECGFSLTETETQMLLVGEDREPPSNPRVTVEQIGEEDVETWSSIQSIGFGGESIPSPASLQLNRAVIRAGGRPYLARVQGEPVGAAILESFQEVWGIYGVATLPAARGQGVGTALMRRMIHDARASADWPICLQAETGTPTQHWYERLGFKVVYNRMGWTLTT